MTVGQIEVIVGVDVQSSVIVKFAGDGNILPYNAIA